MYANCKSLKQPMIRNKFVLRSVLHIYWVALLGSTVEARTKYTVSALRHLLAYFCLFPPWFCLVFICCCSNSSIVFCSFPHNTHARAHTHNTYLK